MNETSTLVAAITAGIQEKKGTGITVVDLRSIATAPCEYFVIATGNAPQHVAAIVDEMTEYVRKRCGEKPARTAGMDRAEWVAADYGTVMVHVFVPQLRDYYDIEHLWEDAELTRVPDLL